VSELRDLTPLLKPRSIAILGATPDHRRVGGRPLPFLTKYAFPGAIYPVNPKHQAIDGVRCYANVGELPEAPDMAIIAVPAARVLDAVRDCQDVGIPAMTVYTSGFAEMGGEGVALERALKEMVAEKGTLLCGPNCQGVANLNDRMCANFSSTLGRDDVAAGPVAFVSQSGLFAGIVAADCHARGLGIGYLVSTGNEAGVDFADVLAYAAADDRIRVVAGYMEGVRDAEKLRKAALVARAHGKPLVILKVGRGAEGAAASASHTGAMAGSYEVYRAAFRQWGIIEVDDIAELFDLVELFSLGVPSSPGDRIGIVTNSGGIGVFSADKVGELGLRMAVFAPETRDAIAQRIPEFGSPQNPVDFTLQAFSDPASVGWHIRHAILDPNVDAAMVFFGVQMLNVAELVEEVKQAAALNDKPVVVCWMRGDPRGPKAFRAAGIPCFDDPLRALKALRALVAQGRIAAMTLDGEPVPTTLAVAGVAEAVRARQTSLGEQAAKAVLADAGIPVTRSILAGDVDAAVAAAEEIGYPVALKVDSADIAHKTEAGGVVLGVDSAAAVRSAHDRIMTRARAYAPDARIDGIGVHEMVSGAVELIVGIKRDAAFGPVVLVGAGGTLVEVMKDVELRVAPVGRVEAEAMVGALKCLPLLSGARGRPRADIAAVVDVIERLSALALAAPALDELDINPLMVMPEGEGARAADALITLVAEED
jgi:acetyltransferase